MTMSDDLIVENRNDLILNAGGGINNAQIYHSIDLSIKWRRGNDMEFDLIHVDASLANAFRRIMIAEVPTMAIETVYIMNNTSVIPDEVLAHRLGLVPIRADPDKFEYFRVPDIMRSSRMSTTGVPIESTNASGPNDPSSNPATQPTENDTLVFKLKVHCQKNRDAPQNSTDPQLLYKHAHVYASDLIWEPQGIQAETLEEIGPIGPVHPEILIDKLRPGQEIDLTAHCQLGIGADHAKFSPVSTASYRLHPHIEILNPITGEDAELFKKCFSPGVIGIRKDEHGADEAYVIDSRNDSVSRECLRYEEFKDKVRLGRIKDHFIFTIESVGSIPPERIFLKSISILKEKCRTIREALMTQLEPSKE